MGSALAGGHKAEYTDMALTSDSETAAEKVELLAAHETKKQELVAISNWSASRRRDGAAPDRNSSRKFPQ